MRHKVDGRKFDRNTGARRSLFRNMVTQLFQHDRIVTTEAKAKEVRRIAEKLITKAKREDLHARRQVLRYVTDKVAVKRLFDIILAKLSDHNTGGYTRIIKIGNRKGDDAPMAMLEILDPGAQEAKARKGSKKKKAVKGKAKQEKAKAKKAEPKEGKKKAQDVSPKAKVQKKAAVKEGPEIEEAPDIEEKANPDQEVEEKAPEIVSEDTEETKEEVEKRPAQQTETSDTEDEEKD